MNQVTKPNGKNIEAFAGNFVDQLKNSWASVLPKICTPERFARVALTSIKKNPKILEALKTEEGERSLAEAFMQCAEVGIEPDGRRAYLIPYKNKITLLFDYKGIVELALRSGKISNIHSDKVCENDEFEFNIGEITSHRINFKEPRGKAYAYYSIVTFKDGTKKCEVMSLEEVDAIKIRSAAWKSFLQFKKECPWNTDYDEMAKKTVFRRLSKWLPLSPEVQRAIDVDDQEYAESFSRKKPAREKPIIEVDPSQYDVIDDGTIDGDDDNTAPTNQIEEKMEI